MRISILKSGSILLLKRYSDTMSDKEYENRIIRDTLMLCVTLIVFFSVA